jgi:ketosteroid isomerase-like protein
VTQGTFVDPRGALEIILGTNDESIPFLDESSVLHIAGSSGLSGDFQSAEAISGLLSRMALLTDHTLRFDTREILVAEDETIVWHGRVRATRLGRQLDSDVVCVLSLDGKRTREMWLFYVNHASVDRFWMARSPSLGHA